MRSFLAIALSPQTRSVLTGLQRNLRAGRLVDPDNLHVTLAFLDDQPEDALGALHEELSLFRVPSFPLTLRGVGCFGGELPRLVYADVEMSDNLMALNREVSKAVRRAGITLKRRKFHPHVTLARLKPHNAPAVAPFLSSEATFHHDAGPVTSFVLYESILRPEGPTYHPLAEYDLV
ncbi:RNA 2',3'-cyclic phosphodiesterase [Tropicibacter sp. R16_0]|uniref:RNA 2',3'-cyclic phosphodiesterase n=1 Tax=Tropicibacter sp. R16_0 TaxID=2821102 RepID=UPI001ADD4156|nr:RNA 2',3'-cyclic phosphodiesterase [Tropicibacter sp. R16_0]MBO9450393.1 RNA 2',3'-cyclic phosphodiesterase [Tropicibacter sp. R16_0]